MKQLRRDANKQQIQNHFRIAPIMLLFAGLCGTNLGRVTHPTLNAYLFQQLQEPLHRAGGFNAHHHRPFQAA